MGVQVYNMNEKYRAIFDPIHPCRYMSTRACPAYYNDVCGDNPCARFESYDKRIWLKDPESKMKIFPDEYLDSIGHWPSIAPKEDDGWGVYCQPCSNKVQTYVKCKHLKYVPDVLIAKEEQYDL